MKLFFWIASVGWPYFMTATPPAAIPKHLYGAFTLNEQIPVSSFYRDDSYSPAQPLIYDFETIEMLKKKALAKEENYYGSTDRFLYAALEAYPIQGKTVAIMGSTVPWYEAVVLAHGGKPVTIEYNKILSQHPDVLTMTVAEYETNPQQFDAVLSISSYEHDGLGRYGDAIDPYGDLTAMTKTKGMLRPGGLLFLAVPIGRDLLAWNAHRVYGPKRFPLLVAGWKILDSFGFQLSDFEKNEQGFQPIFVLQ